MTPTVSAQKSLNGRGGTRKTMIVALARRLLIAHWRMATARSAPAASSSGAREPATFG